MPSLLVALTHRRKWDNPQTIRTMINRGHNRPTEHVSACLCCLNCDGSEASTSVEAAKPGRPRSVRRRSSSKRAQKYKKCLIASKEPDELPPSSTTVTVTKRRLHDQTYILPLVTKTLSQQKRAFYCIRYIGSHRARNNM